MANTRSRTAERVRKDIATAQADADATRAEIVSLSGQTADVLRTGDDQRHAAHDAELARLGRVETRTAQRLADLAVELVPAEAIEAAEREREEEEAKERRKAEAEAKVLDVVARLGADYSAPSETIAAFIRDWADAERMAQEHRIPGPEVVSGRSVPATEIVTPDREQPFEAYVNEAQEGRPTQFPHPYKPDGTIDTTKTREMRTFYRTIPGSTRREGGMVRPGLAALVNLPKVTEDGWHAQGVTTNVNHARRPK